MSTRPGGVSSKARLASELTSKANHDPSYAYEACSLWSSILSDDEAVMTDDPLSGQAKPTPPLPPQAMPAAHALYASALARIGRDKDAVREYRKSLSCLNENGGLSGPVTKMEADIRMGMGKGLQRLLRYSDAEEVFLSAAVRCGDNFGAAQGPRADQWISLACSEAARRAALCSVRMGDLTSAISILSDFGTPDEKTKQHDSEISGMLGALLFLNSTSPPADMTKAHNDQNILRSFDLLRYASEHSATPLYLWIYNVLRHDKGDSDKLRPFSFLRKDIFLFFAEANNSAFDDCELINLDDKVLLHSVVMEPIQNDNRDGINPQASTRFWPSGYILPQESQQFHHYSQMTAGRGRNLKEKTWIMKDRAGYGSRGNRIASIEEIMSSFGTSKISTANDEPILCQQIVDPPMIIDGRKFSLRIYVVYFPSEDPQSIDEEKRSQAECFLSTEGLVKFASALYKEDTANDDNAFMDDQYMTNSGRGDGKSSLQKNLRYLRKKFKQDGFDYDMLWGDLRSSVQIVMKRYLDLKSKRMRDHPLQDCRKNQNRDLTFRYSTFSTFYSIPKILGFDFILDSSQNPWLLEVNRFPGLEPRCSSDTDVKHSVIYDAWAAAANRAGFSEEILKGLRPSNHSGCSLEKIIPTRIE